MDGEHVRVVHGTEDPYKAHKRGTKTSDFRQNIDNIVDFPRVLVPEVMHEEVKTHDLFISGLDRGRTLIQRHGLNRVPTFRFKYRVGISLQERVRFRIFNHPGAV